jgi:Abortive infection C-terminus
VPWWGTERLVDGLERETARCPAVADLTNLEKRQLERLLGMGSGYVLDFSNRTFSKFVIDSTGRDPYDAKYGHGSSKANRLRGFWAAETNRVVGKLLADMLAYARTLPVRPEDEQLLAQCEQTVARLQRDSPVQEVDALVAVGNQRDFEVVAKAVRNAIDRDELEAGLDRLHTFVIKYVRSLCEGRGITVDRDTPLHSLFGAYVKHVRDAGHLQSEMTARILKTSISTLEAFNHVRNNQSLAHDNPFLGYEEALLIFNHVASSIRFLRSVDTAARKREVSAAAPTDDDREHS